MTDRVPAYSLYPQSIHAALMKPQAKPQAPKDANPASTFQSMLDQRLVHFSSHAEQRLVQRGIRLGQEQLEKLGGAIDKAASKGAKESLVLFEDMAFIVNVKNRTVVTAMDDAAMQNHVFTQIDSTVLVR